MQKVEWKQYMTKMEYLAYQMYCGYMSEPMKEVWIVD